MMCIKGQMCGSRCQACLLWLWLRCFYVAGALRCYQGDQLVYFSMLNVPPSYLQAL
jgi:hypothetical protein